ncbi:MAG TPA: HD domain-containing protein [Rhodopila sp.]
MQDIEALFGDQAELAEHLLTEHTQGAPGPGGAPTSGANDGSHDRSHLLRVWRNAARIAEQEPDCDRTILTAAVLLHDCVAVEKNSPLRSQASRLAAAEARQILGRLGWNDGRIGQVTHAIEAHSFSAGIPPETTEARVLQDADRLDAIGAIGIARCFYVAGRMGSALYDPADPPAAHRELDDRRFALDHFDTKLFRIAESFQTKRGRVLADARNRVMQDFVRTLVEEIGGDGT